MFATLAVSTTIAVAAPAPDSLTSPANPHAADARTPPSVHDATPLPVALAVNAPFMWSEARSIGVSAYIAVREKLSIRLNVASYEPFDNPIDAVRESEIGYGGRFTDIGAGLQYFPRSVWSGPSIELGVFHRAQETRRTDEMDSPAILETKATGYAARGLIGWSWLGWKKVFVAAAVGASVGRYAGTERTAEDYYFPMYATNDFKRVQVETEAYLRFGVAFGL